MEKITVSAKTYDEALTKALIELQTTSDNARVKVIEEGTKGFFGLGAKPFTLEVEVIKRNDDFEEIKKGSLLEEGAIKKAFNQIENKPETESEKPVKKKYEAKESTVRSQHERRNAAEDHVRAEHSINKKSVKVEENIQASVPASETKKAELPIAKTIRYSEEEVGKIVGHAESFLSRVLAAMQLQISYESTFNSEGNELNVRLMSEEDMGILIGKRGQTLDSLQYLLSLVVNKGTTEYIRVKLDAQDYRSKRKEKLESLARNIAQKVKKTRKPISLEPMNPYERRIIHSALQSNTAVTTKSEGEEPFRHVTIVLRNSYARGRERSGYRRPNRRYNQANTEMRNHTEDHE